MALFNTAAQSYDLRSLKVSFFGLQITKYSSIHFHECMLEIVRFHVVIFRHKIRLLCNLSATSLDKPLQCEDTL